MNQLFLGDCLEVMAAIADKSVNAVITDLPYGTTRNRWDSIIPFDKLWEQYLRIGVENAVYVFTSSQPFTTTLISSNLKMWRHEWIWIKNRGSNFANTVREPFKEHETVQVFSKGKWTYNKQMQDRTGGGVSLIGKKIRGQTTPTDNYGKFTGWKTDSLSEKRVPSSWQKFNTEVGLHPTQKPLALMEYLVKTYTNENDLVLDSCMGSGTVCLAAKNLNRRYIGIEKEDKYFNIAKDRLNG